MNVDSYLKQHKEAAGLVGEIEGKLSNAKQEAQAINQLLIKLLGTLKFHISMEDKFIYPKATASANGKLKSVATKIQSDMAPIGAALEKYARSWSSADKIRVNPDAFVKETNGVIKALVNRIEVEEKTFYPLVVEHL